MNRFASVRARVTIGAVLVLAAVLTLLGVGIVRLVATSMVADDQRSAEVQARNLAIVAELGRLTPELDVDAAGATILQVVTSEGEIIAASDRVVMLPPLLSDIPPPGLVRASTVRIAPLSGPEEDFRVVGVGTESTNGAIAVFAGVSLTETSQMIATLTRIIIGGFAAVLVIVAVLTWFVIARALRPVDEIRTEVDRLSDADLSRRVPVPPHADEIHRLATTMNRMLSRLQASSQRQQAFIADASHELRSPLASLRTQLEVTAAHPQGVDVADAAADALIDVERLQNLTDDLLLLTRVEATPAPGRRVDLRELTARVVAERHADRVPVSIAPGPPVPVAGDADQLSRVITNLLDNAVRHARGRVTVSCAPGPPARLTVEDDGAGVPLADRERIFDRFVRLDTPRSRVDGGTGLGLAIAREIARAHGGDLRASGPEGTSRFDLTLPGPSTNLSPDSQETPSLREET